MPTDLYGWDLLYRMFVNDIKEKEDLLLIFVHWCLTKYGFHCIGIGAESKFDKDAVVTEALPIGWNRNTSQEGISIRYLLDGKLFILRGIPTADRYIFNLVRIEDHVVTSIMYVVADTVMNIKGSLKDVFPDHEAMINALVMTLIKPLHQGAQNNQETQTSPPPDPPRVESYRSNPSRPDSAWEPNPYNRSSPIDHSPGYLRDPRSVGRSDLDPLGGIGPGGGMGVGGGMLFTPQGPRGLGVRDPGIGIPGGGLPRGAIPPGARFDPFGPVFPNRGPNRQGAPDPDHLPPPGYDDMFM